MGRERRVGSSDEERLTLAGGPPRHVVAVQALVPLWHSSQLSQKHLGDGEDDSADPKHQHPLESQEWRYIATVPALGERKGRPQKHIGQPI